MKKTVNTHRPWRMWVAAGPTSTFLQKLKTGQGQKPPLWVSSKLSLASRKPSGQITIVIHPFIIQGQRVILTHEKMSPLSIPCKSPATSQEPHGSPAKAILPARHERKVPTFSSSPAQHCRNSKGVTIVKNQGDCLSNQTLSGNALHLPLKMPGVHVCPIANGPGWEV